MTSQVHPVLISDLPGTAWVVAVVRWRQESGAIEEVEIPLPEAGGEVHAVIAGRGCHLRLVRTAEASGVQSLTLTVDSDQAWAGVSVGLALDLPWNPAAYLLHPGSLYDGNRRPVIDDQDPAVLVTAAANGAMPMADLQRLECRPDGTQVVELSTLSGAWPCWAALDPQMGWGAAWWWIPDPTLAVQAVVRADRLRLMLARGLLRSGRAYRGMRLGDMAQDPGLNLAAHEAVRVVADLQICACSDLLAGVSQLVARAGHHLAQSAHPQAQIAVAAAAELVQAKCDRENWDPAGFYSIFLHAGGRITWEVGWTGGGMATLAGLLDDHPLRRQRAAQTLDYWLQYGQSPSGMFHSGWDGSPRTDRGGWHLIRRTGDGLVFLIKQTALLRERGHDTTRHDSAIRRAATALVRLWDEHHDLGHYVDADTGEMVVAGSAAGASAIAGLALAGWYLAKPRWLAVAQEAALAYDQRFVQTLRHGGGPDDALQASDSESAWGLVLAATTVAQITGDPQWWQRAVSAATGFLTWVGIANHPWPAGTTLGKLDIATAGMVWANIRNKHFGPGICTDSGVALLAIARATGRIEFAQWAARIARALPQCVSRPERPIHCRELGRDLPSGWLNEAVIPDPEGAGPGVGEVWYGSCWPESSLLLTWAEMPGVWWQPATGTCVVADQIRAVPTTTGLQLCNSTELACTVTVFIDDGRVGHGPFALRRDHYRAVTVPAFGTATIENHLQEAHACA